MRHGSLFSGIGGFDLAAEWMGWENVFHCEWMEFPRKVLEYYWPDADSHIDICKTDFKKYANKIDILTGGFPCQPFSMAGKRKGTNDERYLWGEMLRAIQEIKPKYVIAENVFGITNIDGGLVFEQVCLDLEAEGYEVQPFIIAAAAKTLRTDEIDAGLLLKTPCSADAYTENLSKKEQKFGNSGTLAQEVQSGFIYQRGMLPTPTVMDSTNATATMKSTQVKEGSMHSMTLTRLLCTPTAQCGRGNTSDKRGKGNLTDQIAEMELTTSKTSQLNPRFVAEMMGFPANWTELPFLNGEQNQLKDTVTQ